MQLIFGRRLESCEFRGRWRDQKPVPDYDQEDASVGECLAGLFSTFHSTVGQADPRWLSVYGLSLAERSRPSWEACQSLGRMREYVIEVVFLSNTKKSFLNVHAQLMFSPCADWSTVSIPAEL